MARVQVPFSDSKYVTWLSRFAEVADENAAELNLTPGQTAAITEMANEFELAFRSNLAAKQYAMGQSATKREVRITSEKLVRSTAKLIAINDTISENLKAELGLSVTTRPSVPVEPVACVTAMAYANGTNKIRWNRGGNTQGTNFIVEARFEHAGKWTFVGVTTKCKFEHKDQIPGQRINYRVISQRAGKQSMPSNITSVYDDYSKSAPLKLAA